MEIRRLPATEPRVETGPVQFGNDWPGVFIRGDGAAYYAFILRDVLETTCMTDLEVILLKNLLRDLESAWASFHPRP